METYIFWEKRFFTLYKGRHPCHPPKITFIKFFLVWYRPSTDPKRKPRIWGDLDRIEAGDSRSAQADFWNEPDNRPKRAPLSHIKEQVEELSRQLESLQQNMQAKDQENQDKVTKLKNEVLLS